MILQLSTAAQQLLTDLALATPLQWGPRPRKTRGRPLMYQAPRCESLSHDVRLRTPHTNFSNCTPSAHLAEETGVARIGSYMADLERDIARSHAAFVGAAVTEIATFRGAALGPELRLGRASRRLRRASIVTIVRGSRREGPLAAAPPAEVPGATPARASRGSRGAAPRRRRPGRDAGSRAWPTHARACGGQLGTLRALGQLGPDLGSRACRRAAPRTPRPRSSRA